jgi:hypothetical protein
MLVSCLKGAVALALGLAAAACSENLHVSIGDGDGVPLSELNMDGAAPTKLALASPDRVVVLPGEALDIEVTGDAAAIAALRFDLEDGRLGIMRERDSRVKEPATITVTMPPAREFLLAGSGEIEAPSLVDTAEVNIAGSGRVAVAKIDAHRLNVNVMGSGLFEAAGAAQQLDLNVAGSGMLAAKRLKVERAEVNIAGSGGGEFASDGTVSARVAGSGEVTVFGRANCKISAMGSGKLRCRTDDSARDNGTPAAPRPAA